MQNTPENNHPFLVTLRFLIFKGRLKWPLRFLLPGYNWPSWVRLPSRDNGFPRSRCSSARSRAGAEPLSSCLGLWSINWLQLLAGETGFLTVGLSQEILLSSLAEWGSCPKACPSTSSVNRERVEMNLEEVSSSFSSLPFLK